MRSKITDSILLYLSNSNAIVSEEDRDVIKYGIETMYIIISKVLLLSLLTYLMGIFKEFIIFFIIYGIIKIFSFGVHALKSWICNIVSIMIFVLVPIICKYLILPKTSLIISEVFLLLIFLLYSPADTASKPIISNKRRLIYKNITLCTAIIYIICSCFINDNFISNCFLLAMFVQSVMIMPITYRLFGQPYANYKDYMNKEG